MCMSDSPVSMHNPGNDAPAKASEAPDPAAQKQMEQAYAQMKRKMAMAEIGKNQAQDYGSFRKRRSR